MAWIYLLLVILVFYTPGGFRIPIPLTDTRWLLFWSLISWWVLWFFTRQLEKRTGFDIFYWLDQHMPFLHLRERWIYTIRPPISTQLAVWLAMIGLILSLVKVVSVLLLGVLIQTVLPGLIESLVVRFYGAGWVETLVGCLSGPVIDWLSNALEELLGFEFHAYLLAVSILVMAANRAYQREREKRYHRDIKRLQERRKRSQGEIVISSLVQ